MRGPNLNPTAERAALQPLADAGLSLTQAARILGVTRNSATHRARVAGIRFHGEQRPGAGCNSAQARQGWATRRAKGWTPAPAVVPRVTRRATPTHQEAK